MQKKEKRKLKLYTYPKCTIHYDCNLNHQGVLKKAIKIEKRLALVNESAIVEPCTRPEVRPVVQINTALL